MILPPKHINAHLPSMWTAAVCATMLGVGLHGATQPVLPDSDMPPLFLEIGENVEFVEFQAPGDPAPEEMLNEPEEEMELEEVIEEDVEIPPLPEIVMPLTPPEMPDLAELEEIRPPEPPKIAPQPSPEKPKTESKPKPKPKPRVVNAPNKTGTGSGGGGGSGPPTVFSGGGKGRFPAPPYPSSARSAGAQGTVRLLVVVEATGVPSSVSIQSSSGSSQLDASAVGTISRRWRWPQGNVRRYIVPIRYVLNQ
ncbi:TonB family protein [Phragmitibacter flavus]|uniref:TonB family protein n=1 Tax=Phragmitibacter flavus TaxID=2576071 RepID=A0A5R8KFV7_9BACT|nr:TonB family protein [Phragmitibacter flavus]TLD71111.1 TonB family protein [Phragmitibacter flavus]